MSVRFLTVHRLDGLKVLFQYFLMIKSRLVLLLAALVPGFVLTQPSSLLAGDWTQFRGPGGRATSDATTVPAEFTEEDYNWKIDLPGLGHGSPVVFGEKLFLTVVTADSERKVICYDTKDGEISWQWAQKFDKHGKHDFNEFASTTPCLDDKALYISWSSGTNFHAIALNHNGQLLWERELGGFKGDHGSGTSPVLVGGNLFLFWDELGKQRTSYAMIDAGSGETIWKHVRDWPSDRKELKTTYSTPTLFENSKGETEILVSSMAFGIQSLDPQTGEENWRFDEQAGVRTVASPVVEDGVIFATWGSGNGAKAHAAIIAGSENEDGKPTIAWKWDSNKGLPYVPTPLAHNGLLYMWNDAGVLTCVRAKDGEVVFGPERVSGRYFSNPILIGDKIYCGSREDSEGGPAIVVVEASETFKILARNPLEAGVNATPAVADGKLFIRTDKHLISVGG
ncbi:MAG: outer membrane protein assembly factor BamB [Verrucomicrobiales bacterium]|jgi:outer membrane protein assembly factor BamB